MALVTIAINGAHALGLLFAGNAENTGGTGMHLITWIILGLVAGFIASKIVNKRGEGLFLDIILGIVGAVVGGWIVRMVGIGSGVSGLNIPSLLIAVIGAVVFLIIYHAIRRTV